MIKLKFTVTDSKTGTQPDLCKGQLCFRSCGHGGKSGAVSGQVQGYPQHGVSSGRYQLRHIPGDVSLAGRLLPGDGQRRKCRNRWRTYQF